MDLAKPYVRGLMLYDFKERLGAAESLCRFNSEFSDETVSEHLTQDCFARFGTGQHDVEDRPLSGWTSGINDGGQHQLFIDDRKYKTVQLMEAWGFHNEPCLSS